jgi:polyisoprenoid-binding protein YceI
VRISRLGPALLSFFQLAVAGIVSAAPARYKIDPKDSVFAVVTRKDPHTILSGAAHDHAIHASELAGTIEWDAADPSSCRIEIVLPVSGLRADDPTVRKRIGLPGTEILPKNRGDVEEHMRAEDQLDAEKFPEIRFVSTGCAGGPAGSLRVKGDLTVHGTKKAIETEVKYRADSSGLRARARFVLKHGDFNMKPYSAALGTVKNADELTFVIEAKADLDKAEAKPASP